MRGLTVVTAKKQKLLDIIVKFTKENGHPPTNQEMSDLSGWPITTIHRICVSLLQAGLLRKESTPGRKFWPASG
jgi:DNA-binding IclR family transcriptional regulator